jgi:hypothetical protein
MMIFLCGFATPLRRQSSLQVGIKAAFGKSHFFEFIPFFKSRRTWSALKSIILGMQVFSYKNLHLKWAYDTAMV